MAMPPEQYPQYYPQYQTNQMPTQYQQPLYQPMMPQPSYSPPQLFPTPTMPQQHIEMVYGNNTMMYQQPPMQYHPQYVQGMKDKQQQVIPPKYGQANDLPRFGLQTYFTGEKVAIAEIVNKNIVLKNYKIIESKYKNQTKTCGMYQFSFVKSRDQNIYDLPDYIFISGSRILQDQMEKYSAYLPFYTKLVFVKNKYYSFDIVNFNDST